MKTLVSIELARVFLGYKERCIVFGIFRKLNENLESSVLKPLSIYCNTIGTAA
jgi:hypothetical protein